LTFDLDIYFNNFEFCSLKSTLAGFILQDTPFNQTCITMRVYSSVRKPGGGVGCQNTPSAEV